MVIARDAEGRYEVLAGNIVDAVDGLELEARVKTLAALDKSELKARYKDQLRKPREDDATSGAGLGLIDMARKAAQLLSCSLRKLGNGRVFFSMCVVM